MKTTQQVISSLGISRSQLYILRHNLKFVVAKHNSNLVRYYAGSVDAYLKKVAKEFGVKKFIPQTKLQVRGYITNRQALQILGKCRKSRLSKVVAPRGFTLGNGGPQLVFSEADVLHFKVSKAKTTAKSYAKAA